MIMALDVALATGWAVRTDGGRVLSGVKRFTSQSNHAGDRYEQFSRWLESMIDLHKPPLIVVEQPYSSAQRPALVQNGLVAVAQMVACGRAIAMPTVAPSALKKFATGKGNAPKDAVIAAMRRRGYRPADDNEADALALLHYGEDKFRKYLR